ncbi:CDC42BPG [Symbiodinium pilosum]|uniref:non-specific serine/threonine protein kinase n=1 Tax=Symbiodinium pilosum TaxID=2952 RepID=A0A812T561_SYMPI|nr:CDC42BPG [Symbiodinium pilosum]
MICSCGRCILRVQTCASQGHFNEAIHACLPALHGPQEVVDIIGSLLAAWQASLKKQKREQQDAMEALVSEAAAHGLLLRQGPETAQAAKFFARAKEATRERKEHRDQVDRWSTADFETLAILGKARKLQKAKRMPHGKDHYKKKKNALAFNERDALAGLSARWCTTLLCAFQDARNLFMVMEFLQGGSLTTHITRRGRLSLEETAFYMAELIEAVSVVHRYGHVHRDLKPDNMMLGAKGHLKLLDFGLSAARDESGVAKCDMICGTPEYMSPEAFEGYSSCKSDIWAIGVITYECLTGLLPFDVPSDTRTVMDKVDAIAEQACSMEEVLPEKLQLARDRQFVVGTPDSEFSKARMFLQGVLRSNDAERLSMADCREEALFDGLDFASLHQMPPPLKIKVSSPTDLTYFDVPDYEPEPLPPPHNMVAWDPSLEWANFGLDGQVYDATRKSRRESKY